MPTTSKFTIHIDGGGGEWYDFTTSKWARLHSVSASEIVLERDMKQGSHVFIHTINRTTLNWQQTAMTKERVGFSIYGTCEVSRYEAPPRAKI